MRKARPLPRDKATFRDDRLLIIACDDRFAPEQYFNFFNFSRVKVHVIPTMDSTSTAERVLERLLAFDYDADDERWLLLDTDHVCNGTHLRGTTVALQRARQAGVQTAFSRPCFEIWLLLHHVDEIHVTGLATAAAAESALRTTLGSYRKNKLDANRFSLDLVAEACARAARLDADAGGEIPIAVTSRVYQIWQSVFRLQLGVK